MTTDPIPSLRMAGHTEECDGCNETQCDACPRVVLACHIAKGYAPGVGEAYACHAFPRERCGYCESQEVKRG